MAEIETAGWVMQHYVLLGICLLPFVMAFVGGIWMGVVDCHYIAKQNTKTKRGVPSARHSPPPPPKKAKENKMDVYDPKKSYTPCMMCGDKKYTPDVRYCDKTLCTAYEKTKAGPKRWPKIEQALEDLGRDHAVAPPHMHLRCTRCGWERVGLCKPEEVPEVQDGKADTITGNAIVPYHNHPCRQFAGDMECVPGIVAKGE